MNNDYYKRLIEESNRKLMEVEKKNKNIITSNKNFSINKGSNVTISGKNTINIKNSSTTLTENNDINLAKQNINELHDQIETLFQSVQSLEQKMQIPFAPIIDVASKKQIIDSSTKKTEIQSNIIISPDKKDIDIPTEIISIPQDSKVTISNRTRINIKNSSINFTEPNDINLDEKNITQLHNQIETLCQIVQSLEQAIENKRESEIVRIPIIDEKQNTDPPTKEEQPIDPIKDPITEKQPTDPIVEKQPTDSVSENTIKLPNDGTEVLWAKNPGGNTETEFEFGKDTKIVVSDGYGIILKYYPSNLIYETHVDQIIDRDEFIKLIPINFFDHLIYSDKKYEFYLYSKKLSDKEKEEMEKRKELEKEVKTQIKENGYYTLQLSDDSTEVLWAKNPARLENPSKLNDNWNNFMPTQYIYGKNVNVIAPTGFKIVLKSTFYDMSFTNKKFITNITNLHNYIENLDIEGNGGHGGIYYIYPSNQLQRLSLPTEFYLYAEELTEQEKEEIDKKDKILKRNKEALDTGIFQLFKDDQDILWARNPGNNEETEYIYNKKNIKIVAPEGYKIILKSVENDSTVHEFDPIMTEITNLHDTIKTFPTENGMGYGDLLYLSGESNHWHHWKINFYFYPKRLTDGDEEKITEKKDIIDKQNEANVNSGEYTLSKNGEPILWAKNPGNESPTQYILNQEINLFAPDGYKIILKSVDQDGTAYEYDTTMTEISNLHNFILKFENIKNALFYSDWLHRSIKFYFYAKELTNADKKEINSKIEKKKKEGILQNEIDKQIREKGFYTLNLLKDGTEELWATTKEDGSGHKYKYGQNVKIVAPVGCNIVLKSIEDDLKFVEYKTEVNQINDLHDYIIKLPNNPNGTGFGGLYYMAFGNMAHWLHLNRSFYIYCDNGEENINANNFDFIYDFRKDSNLKDKEEFTFVSFKKRSTDVYYPDGTIEVFKRDYNVASTKNIFDDAKIKIIAPYDKIIKIRVSGGKTLLSDLRIIDDLHFYLRNLSWTDKKDGYWLGYTLDQEPSLYWEREFIISFDYKRRTKEEILADEIVEKLELKAEIIKKYIQRN